MISEISEGLHQRQFRVNDENRFLKCCTDFVPILKAKTAVEGPQLQKETADRQLHYTRGGVASHPHTHTCARSVSVSSACSSVQYLSLCVLHKS